MINKTMASEYRLNALMYKQYLIEICALRDDTLDYIKNYRVDNQYLNI